MIKLTSLASVRPCACSYPMIRKNDSICAVTFRQSDIMDRGDTFDQDRNTRRQGPDPVDIIP